MTHIPVGYFFLSTPPIEDTSLLEYRTVDSKELLHPSRDLLDTITEMKNLQDWMKDYLKVEQADKLSYVNLISIENSTFDISSKIRETLGIK